MSLSVPRDSVLLMPLAVARAAADAAVLGGEAGRPANVYLFVDPATRLLRLVANDAKQDYTLLRATCVYSVVDDHEPLVRHVRGFRRVLALPGHPEIVAIRSSSPNYDRSDRPNANGDAALADLRQLLGLPDGWGDLDLIAPTDYAGVADADPLLVDGWVRRHLRARGVPPSEADALLTREDAMADAVGAMTADLREYHRLRLVIEGIDPDYDRLRAACATPCAEVAVDGDAPPHDMPDPVYLPREEA